MHIETELQTECIHVMLWLIAYQQEYPPQAGLPAMVHLLDMQTMHESPVELAAEEGILICLIGSLYYLPIYSCLLN